MSRVKLVEKHEVEGELLSLYEQLERSRGGTVPNMFMALGYSAQILGPAVAAADFPNAETSVLPKEKQLAYLAASRVNHCEYCLERHSVAGKKAGLTDEQIHALHQEGDLAGRDAFTDRERVILRFAEELTRNVAVQTETFDSLRRYFSDEQIVELTYTVAQANMFNRIANGLQIELEPQFR